jgi:hypothetical protein
MGRKGAAYLDYVEALYGFKNHTSNENESS